MSTSELFQNDSLVVNEVKSGEHIDTPEFSLGNEVSAFAEQTEPNDTTNVINYEASEHSLSSKKDD